MNWLASLQQTDLQHEVDILKGSGDNVLVTLLGDLDAVREWFLQLGLLEVASNNR